MAGAQEYQPKHGAPHSVLGREPRLGEDTVNVGRLGILVVFREGVGIELETLVETIHMDNGHTDVDLHCNRHNGCAALLEWQHVVGWEPSVDLESVVEARHVEASGRHGDALDNTKVEAGVGGVLDGEVVTADGNAAGAVLRCKYCRGVFVKLAVDGLRKDARGITDTDGLVRGHLSTKRWCSVHL